MKKFPESYFQSVRLGDRKYKPFGVTPEPEVRTKLIKGHNSQEVRFNFELTLA